MNSIAMNLVANMMNTTFNEVNYVNRSGQSGDSSNFKEVIQKTRNVSNNVETKAEKNESQQAKRLERPKERVQISANKQEVKTQEKLSQNEGTIKDEPHAKNVVTDSEGKALEAIESMNVLSQEIIQAIAEIMNVTVEEVQATLQKLDMEVDALFDVNQLMEFVTEQLNLESSTDVLITEGAIEKYKQMATLLEEVAVPFNELKQKIVDESALIEVKTQPLNNPNPEMASSMSQGQNTDTMDFAKEESSETLTPKDLDKSLLPTNNEEKSSVPTGFETTLNQVVTEKVETIVINGEIRTVHTQITAKDVFDQIVTGLKVEITEGKQDIILQLQPENLGKIAVNISKENGIISGQFVAESEAVKSMIEKNIPVLKQQLEAQGIDLRDIKIVVGDSKAFFAGKDSERETEHFKQAMSQNKKRNMKIDRIQERISEDIENEAIVNHNQMMDTEISSIEFQA